VRDRREGEDGLEEREGDDAYDDRADYDRPDVAEEEIAPAEAGRISSDVKIFLVPTSILDCLSQAIGVSQHPGTLS
jgi:hypothetical protein